MIVSMCAHPRVLHHRMVRQPGLFESPMDADHIIEYEMEGAYKNKLKFFNGLLPGHERGSALTAGGEGLAYWPNPERMPVLGNAELKFSCQNLYSRLPHAFALDASGTICSITRADRHMRVVVR